ncbi:MAG: SRPBCC domain-containing protein [Bacteroidales bacterium]|nr:SRPBCC domain-containing protein [Bacteroidales bacterium]
MAKEIKTEIQINSSAEKVWSILTDFENYSKWNPFIQSLDGKVIVGERIKVHIVPPEGKGMRFKPKVLVYDENKELRWLGHLLFPGLFDGEHQFEIIDNKNGTTCLRQNEKFIGLLTFIFGTNQLNNTKKGFELMNSAIKIIAESK